MAHPKLVTVAHRSLLTATTAALIAGPLAAAGAAQTLDDVTDTLDLTCEEALETEEANLIDEFCTAEELEELASPLSKSVDDVTKTTEETTKTVKDTADGDGDGGKDGGETSAPAPTKVLEETENSTDGGGGKKNVQGAGEEPEGFNPEDSSTSGSSSSADKQTAPRQPAASDSYGYNADGPFRPGMQSHSALTLQPFAAPLVSVPPVYELPQVAQQLFGTTTGVAGAEAPEVAGATAGSTSTTAAPYSPTGYTATSADPTGWLAATATGLIMLVGAGHALNGGRKPARKKA